MPKRSTSNLIDIHTGKPIEAPKKKSAANASSPGETADYKWAFKSRFRRKAFGWKSQPAITRIREAVSEIKKVARTNSALAGEGAVLFLERLSPAIEQIDGSSGSIGSAVNKAIEDLVPIIANATVDRHVREEWLERLFKAHQEDQIREIPGIVFDIINKEHKKKYVYDIVSSQMDVDRFDYLMRDSFMTGVKYGDLDLNWILRTLQVGEVVKDGKVIKTLALNGTRGLSAVESYILGRHYMYMHVYYHKTIQAAESMLMTLLSLAVKETEKNKLESSHPVFKALSRKEVLSLPDYLSLNDFGIFSLIQQWESYGGPLGDLSKRLNRRDIFSCIVMSPTLTHLERLDRDKKNKRAFEEAQP